MSAPLLSMKGISKSFGGTAALSEASLEVLPGEVHALIGQNGAGKSTLIKVLTGYHRKDGGNVSFEGRPFEVGSPRAAQEAGISTIYQEINLVPQRSVTENICLGRETRRYGLLDWRAMRAEAKRLLARFNLDLDVDQPLSQFSTATQQMVAIARAVGFSARLVIMDEPTSSLDDREAQVLFSVIRGLRDEGVSVLFVSHRLDELYEVCDQVTIMRDGRTVRMAAMTGITKLELVSTMLGRDVARAEGRATGFGTAAKPPGAPVLRASDLSDGRAVRDVGLSVAEGEIVGLAGLLGAGRSETARLIFGDTALRVGSMLLNGSAYTPRQPSDAIRAGLGFCTEDRKIEGIVPDMSVADNMMLALRPAFGRSGIVDEARQTEIVNRFIGQLGIKCTGPDQKIRELSGGNQQKVLLARWLAMSPKLLILDEPTRGIDVGAKDEIQRLIRSLADQGLAVLMISSELEEVVEGADRVFVLREGLSVADIARADLTEDRVLAAMAHGGTHG
ncbi:sugar ABC transporter ATP-binding protein [Tabrizicola sp.]|uniref:sugar ABC transporter ATP-binding protein n=1 Tax=Tabrizicola sp. TaxID=2005166 RepID=UPI003F3CEF73